MSNYIVEGNINFFEELYKSLDVEEKEEKDETYAIHTNTCLITNDTLENYYVTMKCGHKFNYVPLYKYLINYKQKFNSMESSKQKLDINEIRCPYCRCKQKELLPYYNNIKGVKKVNGVNNEYIKPCFNNQIPCCYIIDGISNTCGKYYSSQLPDDYKEKDGGYYCLYHIKIEIAHQKYLEKQKLLQDKINAKEELKKLKMSLKKNLQKEKNDKKNLDKKNLQKEKNENVILESVVEENVIQCQSIIKYGYNKGNSCSFKPFQNG
jgi:hypothetical protein